MLKILRSKGQNALDSKSPPGAGTVITAIISEASSINNQQIPYEWGGGHTSVGIPDAGIPGDNSRPVSLGNLMIRTGEKTVIAPTQLQRDGFIRPGAGVVVVSCDPEDGAQWLDLQRFCHRHGCMTLLAYNRQPAINTVRGCPRFRTGTEKCGW